MNTMTRRKPISKVFPTPISASCNKFFSSTGSGAGTDMTTGDSTNKMREHELIQAPFTHSQITFISTQYFIS